MKGNVKPIPDGYHAVTPYLVVEDAGRVLEFVKKAFDATETERHTRPDGTVMHAEVRIGDSVVMMGAPDDPAQATRSMIYLYVEDSDAAYARALEAGATPIDPPADQFYGDRRCAVKDPAGNSWYVATHVEDVPPAELERRMREARKA